MPRGAKKPSESKEEKKPSPKEEEMLVDNVGNVEAQPIVDEMRRSYLDYAMSVIVSRALPDVRDGLQLILLNKFMNWSRETGGSIGSSFSLGLNYIF
jgi:hypothetical protein